MATLMDGIKLSREIASSPAFAPYRGEEVFPGESVQSYGALSDYIRRVRDV